MKNKNEWIGPAEVCDICGGKFGKYFYDGKANLGSGIWGLMCEDCFIEYGFGTGLGKAQKYLTKTKEGVEGFK